MAGSRDITSMHPGERVSGLKQKKFVFAKILNEFFSSSNIAAKMLISERVSQFY
jgi:hypothetical protein